MKIKLRKFLNWLLKLLSDPTEPPTLLGLDTIVISKERLQEAIDRIKNHPEKSGFCCSELIKPLPAKLGDVVPDNLKSEIERSYMKSVAELDEEFAENPPDHSEEGLYSIKALHEHGKSLIIPQDLGEKLKTGDVPIFGSKWNKVDEDGDRRQTNINEV